MNLITFAQTANTSKILNLTINIFETKKKLVKKRLRQMLVGNVHFAS